MTPEEAISKLKLLPENKQREVLGRLSPEERQDILHRLAPPADKVSATPVMGSLPDLKIRALKARNWLVNELPAVGGFAGGMIGLGAGAETGPGAIATSALGAGAGGTLGESARQMLNKRMHPDEEDMSPGEASLRMLLQGGLQGANEIGGQVAGRIIGKGANILGSALPAQVFEKYPFLKPIFAMGENKAPQHLTAAAASKESAGPALEAITRTLGDIEGELSALPKPEQTVDGFLSSVNRRKDAMNVESGAAMLPIADQKTVPIGISTKIRNLIRSYSAQTVRGQAEKKYLINRAAEFEKPWSFRQLDEMRTDLSSRLSTHKAKDVVSQYVGEKGDLNLAVDNAVLDGLRETVYPEMDRAAGKPPGYFEDLKGRQSSLITLQKILKKRAKQLKGAQAVSEAASPLSSEDVSIYAHAGGMPHAYLHGLKEAVAPTREFKEASRHVQKAFKPTVNSLPYQVLLSGATRVEEAPPIPKWWEPDQAPAKSTLPAFPQ